MCTRTAAQHASVPESLHGYQHDAGSQFNCQVASLLTPHAVLPTLPSPRPSASTMYIQQVAQNSGRFFCMLHCWLLYAVPIAGRFRAFIVAVGCVSLSLLTVHLLVHVSVSLAIANLACVVSAWLSMVRLQSVSVMWKRAFKAEVWTC